ncbi:hypothetical protein TCAL_13106, partial [Tigriopus californicus]|eukprot:TCALIF_13106-PA protein Name:"Similar to bacC Bacilysin biosynthesis oxidoreductase BacC (Bacillus subtilis (strain 168))" AED:0.14 eAED:0.14 QI:44/0/0/1/0.8/0.83/6/0/451
MATACFKGKVILITGASSGIGAGTAKHFAALGAKLALIARNEAKLNEIAADCRAAGAEDVFVSPHDLGIAEECVKAVENTVSHFGGLDVLVNNAGIMHTQTLATLSADDFDEAMRVNVLSAVKMIQAASQHLESSPLKNVVNVSSIAGLRAYPGAIAYKMSKAAMDQLTRCSALELAPKGTVGSRLATRLTWSYIWISGIRVNSVNPGVIDTELFEKSGMNSKGVKAYFERSKKTHPLGRVGRVEEVASCIAFLASDGASFVTGQTLAIDGGRSVQCPRLDVFVNSAGILVNGDTATGSLEDYDRCMNINTRSAFILSQAVIPHLIKTKGNMVHISSVCGLRAFPGVLAYSMSKAAVDQLVRTCALELAAQGVRVNAVNPGVIVTEIHKNAGMNDVAYAAFLEKGKRTHALGRVGTVEEVAHAVAFLASNESAFITGATLPIDGGRNIMSV